MSKTQLKLDIYCIISCAVDGGLHIGVNRAFKHTKTPSIETIIDAAHNEIMNSLSEVVDWNHDA